MSTLISDVPSLEARVAPMTNNLAEAMRHPPVANTFMHATDLADKAMRNYHKAKILGKRERGASEEDNFEFADLTRGLMLKAKRKYNKLQARLSANSNASNHVYKSPHQCTVEDNEGS